MVMYGNAWQCLVMYGYVWLCMYVRMYEAVAVAMDQTRAITN